MDLIKKLTSKNKQDYEMAASHIINSADVMAFSKLVSQDDFLFDFIKKNVAVRLEKAVNKDNYQNLLKFLPFYSSSYLDFIVKSLAKFANENLTDEILERLENGSDEEKAYCASYFAEVQDTLALDFLRKYAFNEFEPLASNCATTLAVFADKVVFEQAIEKLRSNDDFEKFSAIKFLVSYGDVSALPHLFEELKKSSMAENIAAEIPYLKSLLELLKSDYENTLYTINLVVDGLGETSLLSQVFDFQLFEVLETLLGNLNSKEALILLNAKNKFDTLTENNEYLYDEDKNTKTEIFEIKKMLASISDDELIKLASEELKEDSCFVLAAIDLIKNEEKLLILTNSKKPTIVLKALEALKIIGKMDKVDKSSILSKIEDENIKAVIAAL